MRWPFFKYRGCGNDFILFDNRHKAFPLFQADLIKRLCHRQMGIGADGVLLLESSSKADYGMRIFNADGSEAEMCGNGLRCLVQWLFQKGLKQGHCHIEVRQHLFKAASIAQQVCIEMDCLLERQWHVPVTFAGQTLHLHYLHIGVPHTVLFVEAIETIDLATLGPYIRYHPLWSPQGTNVNLVQWVKDQHFKVRTYERGVEAETLACGTGATAAALAFAYQMGLSNGPFSMETLSGETLTVNFKRQAADFSEVTLTGPACCVFQGEVELLTF